MWMMGDDSGELPNGGFQFGGGDVASQVALITLPVYTLVPIYGEVGFVYLPGGPGTDCSTPGALCVDTNVTAEYGIIGYTDVPDGTDDLLGFQAPAQSNASSPGPGSPQSRQSPTWLLQTKVFLSSLGQNFVNEFTPNGCFAQFANELATGQAAGASPPGAGPEDVIRSAGQAGAASYVVTQGLAYPLKSSVYRGILGLTETAAGAATLLPLIGNELTSGYHEMQSLASGTCK
jgi:hypothetical protein